MMSRNMKVSFACSLLALAVGAMEAGAAERPPNILFILGDNLGKDWFGCYRSDEGTTPNIDSLAAGGARFAHCYMTALCSTSRAAIYSGRYGFRTGWHTHHDAAIYGGGGFDWEREITIARVLKNAGYATAITGKWQINDLYEQRDAITRHGFDEHLLWTGNLVGEGNADRRWRASIAPGGNRELESRYWDPIVFHNAERLTLTGKFGPDEYVNYLVDFMERHKDRPFFAVYASPLTHVPPAHTPGGPRADASDREKYIGMVRHLDQQVGRLVRELERLKLRDNTMVFFATDNGSSRHFSGHVGGKMVPGGLGTQSEPGLDTPLVVNCPARVVKGQVSDALVDCTDFFATFAELAGAALPSGVAIDGRSFAAELDGRPETRSSREWMFAEYAGVRIVRDRRYKLYSDGRLFDIVADWLEKTDLAGSRQPEVAAARTRLQAVLDQLPPDVNLPFEPRSSSAFRLRGVQP
jgi:arylsulfatase A-like enzyme